MVNYDGAPLAGEQEAREILEVQVDPYREILFRNRNLLGDNLEQLKEKDPRFNRGSGELNPRYKNEVNQEGPKRIFTPEEEQQIKQAVGDLGMLREETPLPVGQYDVAVALGGARFAPLDRLNNIVKAMKSGSTVGNIVIVGSNRKLKLPEIEAVEGVYARGAETEFDLCTSAVNTVCKENPGLIISSVFDPRDRAHTMLVVDTAIGALADRLPPKPKVVVSTTQIYAPATELNVRAALMRRGIHDIYVSGHASNPEIVKNRTTSTYYSELIAFTRAWLNAQDALSEASTSR